MKQEKPQNILKKNFNKYFSEMNDLNAKDILLVNKKIFITQIVMNFTYRKDNSIFYHFALCC